MEAIHTAWRRYKSQLKKDHYDTYVNDEIRIKKRPAYVPESQFKGLLKYWNSEAVQVRYFSKVQFVHIPNAYCLNILIKSFTCRKCPKSIPRIGKNGRILILLEKQVLL